MSTGNLTNMILSKFNHPIITNSQTFNQNESFNQKESIEEEEIKSIASSNDIGDISNIQLPYNKENNENYKYNYDYNDNIDNNYVKNLTNLCETKQNNEQFCSYVLYFALILILFGYFGYYIVFNKIIASDIVSGINLGVLIGFIVVILLWSSINSS